MFEQKAIQIPPLTKIVVLLVGIVVGVFFPAMLYVGLGVLLISVNFLIEYSTAVSSIAVLVIVFFILSSICKWIVLTFFKGVIIGMIIFYGLAFVGGGL